MAARALACQGLIVDRSDEAVYNRLIRPTADDLDHPAWGPGGRVAPPLSLSKMLHRESALRAAAG